MRNPSLFHRLFTCRIPITLLFVGTILTLLLGIALPVWLMPFSAGRDSVTDLSKQFRRQLAESAAGLVREHFRPTETAARAISSAISWRTDLISSTNNNFSLDFLDDLARNVLYPVLTGVPKTVIVSLARQGFVNGQLQWLEGLILTQIPPLTLRVYDDGTKGLVHPYAVTFAADSYTSSSAMGESQTFSERYRLHMFDKHCIHCEYPVTDITLLDGLCRQPMWDDLAFTQFNTPAFTLSVQIPTLDGNGFLCGTVALLIQSLGAALSASVSGKQRLFLTLFRPDGRLVASSHGKFWSHSDATSFANLASANVSWYTPVQCTDAVIHAAAASLTALLGEKTVWVTRDVDVTVHVSDEDWLALSVAITDGGKALQLWLLQDSQSIFGRVRQALKRTVIVFVILVVLSVVSGVLSALAIAYPLRALSRQLMDVAGMDFVAVERQLAVHRPVIQLREVALLERSFRTMLISVGSFAKYVPVGVVRSILAAGHAPALRVDPMQVTVMFLDIRDFTATSARLTSESVAALLSTVLGPLSACVTENHGTIDKYIGDAIMALWGAPEPMDCPEVWAVRAVHTIMQVLASSLKEALEFQSLPVIDVRIGLHAGQALVGNVGSEERYNYTAVGDVVNAASRLESLNKQFGTRAITSVAVAALAKEEFAFRELGDILLLGQQEPLGVCELRGLLADEPDRALAEWNAAMDAFRTHQWSRASALFSRFVSEHGDTPAANYFIQRAADYSSGRVQPFKYELQTGK